MMNAENWLQTRGITKKTYSSWPVGLEENQIRFEYRLGGKVVNQKIRSTETKQFSQTKDGRQIFWNLDRVIQGPKDIVYITEGEMDALALAEAGIPSNSILAFGGGAPPTEADDPTGKARYGHVIEALHAGLNAVKNFVLVTDNDDPGRALRADLARLLGVGRCHFIEFPDGIKDPNEALINWGGYDLRLFLENYKEWPVQGLYRLDEIPEPPKLTLWSPQIPEWESKVRLAPTMLSVFTGFPGHGKTHFSQQLWFNMSKAYDFPIALMSAETHPVPHVRRNFRQFYWGRLERDLDSNQISQADGWIRDHVLFMNHPNAKPTFSWLIETLEAAVQRDGAKAIVIDPWNKLESEFDSNKSETRWIGECLDELLDAARSLNVHIQVLAHPAKPDSQSRKIKPDLYSISGSAHWSNRVDQGFSIHRPMVVDESGHRQYEANFYHLKSRFEDLGYPCKLGLKFGETTGRFESSDYQVMGSRAA